MPPELPETPLATLRTVFTVLLLLTATAAPAQPLTVVELFTSQGCSSCPPADRLLSRLEESGAVAALSFHVDYWNYIGWTDPFSSEAWSERQRRYAHALQLDTLYTPQIVIDGRFQEVGSKEKPVRELLAQAAARTPRGQVTLKWRGWEGGALRVEATASLATGGRPLDLMVAVVEDGLVTPVGRGENRAKTLRNDGVVRALDRAFALPEGTEGRQTKTLTIPVGEGWQPQNLRLVAFLQDPRTLAIEGAAQLEPPAP